MVTSPRFKASFYEVRSNFFCKYSRLWMKQLQRSVIPAWPTKEAVGSSSWQNTVLWVQAQIQFQEVHTDFWAHEARLSGQSVCVLWFELGGSVEGFLGNPNESGFRDVPSLAADRVPFSFMQFVAELQMCGYIFLWLAEIKAEQILYLYKRWNISPGQVLKLKRRVHFSDLLNKAEPEIADFSSKDIHDWFKLCSLHLV